MVALVAAAALAVPSLPAGTPGALALVVDHGRRTVAVRGFADLRRRTPLRADDRFRVGSVTKTFVAVVALQLVAEGKLRLSDSVEHWLPTFVPGGSRITVRDLLGHTSGLFDYTSDARFEREVASHPRRVWSRLDVLRIAFAHPRGPRRYAYSSTNYVLLGMIVERAGGERLALALRRRIFGPLRLHSTTWSPGSVVPGRHAHGYVLPVHDGIVASLAGARDRTNASASWAGAAGAIVSTADDLSRFYGALLGGRLLPRRLLRELVPRPGRRYGLGLAAFPTPCGRAVGHTGNLLGYVTAVWSTRDGRRRLVAMVNSYPLSPAADTALRRFLERAFCG